MFSVILLLISVAALLQFALYYWRAVMGHVAAQPLSNRILAAAGLEEGRVTAGNFDTLAGLHEITPDLRSGGGGLGLVRPYYHLVDALGALAAKRLPALAAWSQRECALCARYAAVKIDRRLQANLALVASVRSS